MKAHREHGLEIFTAESGEQYVRAQAGEEPDVVYTPRTRGLAPIRLMRRENSRTLRLLERRLRREERELAKRGY